MLRAMFSVSASCLLAALCLIQPCEDHETELKAAAIKAVRDKLAKTLEGQEFLRAIPRDDLDQEFIHFQVPPAARVGQRVRPIRFFEVVPTGYFLRDETIESQAVQVDSYDSWLIAIDSSSLQVFPLRGFENPIEGFNRLMRQVEVRNVNERVVEMASTCLQVTKGDDYVRSIVPDEMWLQVVAISDFRVRLPKRKSLSSYAVWWAQIPRQLRKSLTPPSYKQSAKGFEVSYFHYQEGRITKQIMAVSESGFCSDPVIAILYPLS